MLAVPQEMVKQLVAASYLLPLLVVAAIAAAVEAEWVVGIVLVAAVGQPAWGDTNAPLVSGTS